MDKEKLKLLVRNLELLVDSLKAEVYSDTESYLNYEDIKLGLPDYDEIFDDDDGYPDQQSTQDDETTEKTHQTGTSLH